MTVRKTGSNVYHPLVTDCFAPIKYLDFLLILEPSLADDDILDSSSVSKLLLKHGVVLEELLCLVFRDSVQGVLIDHPNTFKL